MTARFRHTITPEGEVCTQVPRWILHYPVARPGGRLADMGFIQSTNGHGSDFVHFDREGVPYGFPLTVEAHERFLRLRAEFYHLTFVPGQAVVVDTHGQLLHGTFEGVSDMVQGNGRKLLRVLVHYRYDTHRIAVVVSPTQVRKGLAHA